MRRVEGPSIDPSSGRFFSEIEALSKALDVESKPLRHCSRAPGSRSLSSGSSFAASNPDQKEKKPSSLWNWKPLKALSHIRHRRFECVFSLRVHAIENLPPALGDASLCVHWRRTTADSVSVSTRPAAVFRGAAKFDEALSFQCSVYGIRSRAQGSAKYEARNFLIYATVVGAPGLDLGKHRVDLTRLLPLNLEELEEGRSSGNWSTVFRLCGKATGATLSVCFGFSAVSGEDKVQKPCGSKMNPLILSEKRDMMNIVTQVGRLTGLKSQFVDDVNCHGDVSESVMKIMKPSVDVVSGSIASKLEDKVIDEPENSAEMKCCVSSQGPESFKRNVHEREESEFAMIEHEMENSKQDIMNDYVKRKLDSESVIMKGSSQNEVIGAVMNEERDDNSYYDEETGELAILLGQLEEMGYPETNVDDSEKPRVDNVDPNDKEGSMKPRVDNVDPNDKEGSMKTRSHSLDEFTEEVASEFLSMLDLEHYSSDSSHESGPESPRKQLWKQFKTESSVFSDCLFGLDVDVDEEMNWGNSCSGVFDFSSITYDTDSENQCSYEVIESKSKAQILEDAETEALLREWGLDEKVFDGSPPGRMTGFGSPIHLPPEEPPLLPPLCEKLGPFVQTKDGGFLRSMSPNLFKDSKSNGNLIMQVSKPVVMPAEMGSDNTEILQHLASIGVEKLSMQANKLMPLQEITGGLIQKLAWDSVPDVEEHQSQDFLLHLNHEEDDSIFDLNTSERKGNHFGMTPVRSGESTDEYVSLEDLAPLAMDKIEALSMEGLKIQSGMSDEEAPSNITKKFVGEVPGCKGKVGDLTSLGLEGAVGLHLHNVEDNGDDIDGLMGLSISLDEWMQLDMGIVKEECELSDRTSKILAAHHAKSTEFSGRGWRDDRRGKNASRKRGLLENNFTVALMVQLRDPFRNYEPVGTPMLALIQVERVFLPPKPKIYSTVLEKNEIERDIESDTDLEPVLKLEKEDFVDAVPRFKVADVRVAGLKAESGKKRHWGSPIQQQSGSRWLLANGMGKLNKKHPLMKSNTGNKVSQLSAKVQPEETLWSISSRVHGNAHKWNEVPASKPHIRNPSFLFFR